ncbi:MAG TPA: hypothetical protein VFG87_23780 [Amycolatopsis sp.]|nr:hypothetical protein [Amycolatopsis sp.]
MDNSDYQGQSVPPADQIAVSAERFQDGGVRQFRRGGLVDQQSEFVAAGALFGELGGEFLDAG